jgi:hypothetical protein
MLHMIFKENIFAEKIGDFDTNYCHFTAKIDHNIGF